MRSETSRGVRLVFHRVFQPSAKEPLNFEATVERTVRELTSGEYCAVLA
jgi:hypothetical protein